MTTFLGSKGGVGGGAGGGGREGSNPSMDAIVSLVFGSLPCL